MYAVSIKCRNCGNEYPLTDTYLCPLCGGLMEIQYDNKKLLNPANIRKPDHSFSGLWKYRSMLPVRFKRNIVTLGEGNTPLIRVGNAEKQCTPGCNLYVKAEFLNPSGSFKDRPSSVGVSVAKEHGHKAVVVASTGNAAAAVSCYAAHAGMKCAVIIPASTDPGKVTQAQAYGATVFGVDGDFSDAFRISKEVSQRYLVPNITSTFHNPYTIEGDKTIAYELFEALKKVPEYILIPIGTGPLLVGILKGFAELKSMGITDKMPKMIGVQSENCMPIVSAYHNGQDKVCCWRKDVRTVAGGIADSLVGYEQDGELTLRTVRDCGGTMVGVSDAQIMQATDILGSKEGIYAEPTGAVTLAAAQKLYESEAIESGATVVLIVTGHGFKFTAREHKEFFPYEGIDSMKDFFR